MAEQTDTPAPVRHYKKEELLLRHPITFRINDRQRQFLERIVALDKSNGNRANIGRAIGGCIDKMRDIVEEHENG